MKTGIIYSLMGYKTILGLLFLFYINKTEAQNRIVDSLTIQLSKTSDTAKVKTLNRLAFELKSINPDQMLKYAEEAFKLAITNNYLEGQSVSLNNIGLGYRLKSDFEKSIQVFEKSLQISKKYGFKKAEAESYIGIAVDYDYLGKYKLALENYNLSLIIAKNINDKILTAKALMGKAIVHEFQGNLDSALNCHLRSLKINEDRGDQNAIAASNMNIGGLYKTLGNSIVAGKYYEKSLIIREKIGDKPGIAQSLNSLASLYKANKDFEKAKNYYLKSLKIREELGDKRGISIVLGNIGTLYDAQAQFEKAIEYYKKALDLKELSGDNHGKSVCLTNIGIAFKNLGNYKLSIEYLLQGLKISQQMGIKSLSQEIYLMLAQSHSSLKEHQKAFEYMELYANIKDSILNENSSRQIAEMQTKYDTEKKEKEIELLNKDNALQNSEIEKQKNFRNNLVAIIALIIILALVLLYAYQNKKKSNKTLEGQKAKIEMQKELLEEKNKDITDSINYAKRIQKAIITSDAYIKQYLPEHFILYKPKDIVSGDFYWSYAFDNQVIFATADCTGHGVPGAFMSVIGASLLNEIVVERKITRPDLILNHLRDSVIKALNPEGSKEEANDGMDIMLCKFNFDTLKLEYAAANNPLWVIRKNDSENPSSSYSIIEFKADKFPVGKQHGNKNDFTLNQVEIKKGDLIYSFTDGYADQFGGPSGKKFKYKAFQELILSGANKSLEEQKLMLDNSIETWKGNLEQVDDILVVAVKI